MMMEILAGRGKTVRSSRSRSVCGLVCVIGSSLLSKVVVVFQRGVVID